MRKLKKDIWPYQANLKIRSDSGIDEEITKWCNENLGYRFSQWFSYWMEPERRLYAFKDSETLLVFKLKWGQYVIR